MTTKKSVRDVIALRVTEVLINQDLGFTDAQRAAIEEALMPKRGGSTHIKINEDGDVYCNYFEAYINPSKFKKLPNGKYGPLSIDGQKIKQKLATLEKQMNREISTAFIQDKSIDKSALFEKYEKLKQVVIDEAKTIDTTEDKPKRKKK